MRWFVEKIIACGSFHVHLRENWLCRGKNHAGIANSEWKAQRNSFQDVVHTQMRRPNPQTHVSSRVSYVTAMNLGSRWTPVNCELWTRELVNAEHLNSSDLWFNTVARMLTVYRPKSLLPVYPTYGQNLAVYSVGRMYTTYGQKWSWSYVRITGKFWPYVRMPYAFFLLCTCFNVGMRLVA